jgi:trimethylamine--corrinoid protein Co-methyltransferase
MVEGGGGKRTRADMIRYWRYLFTNFSKHVQDNLVEPEEAPWWLEVLEIVFGDKETIRRERPVSFLICPQSPLVIEGGYTDAYLATVGYDIPVACMPMPLMGATAPGSLIGTVLQGNCEVLAMLCLIQAAAPATPFIYAPALAVMDPYTGRYAGGAVEQGLLGAAATEMARYYGLPAESTGFGTDHQAPGIQAAYERTLNGLLPILSWPDLMVGPGLLGGSMNLNYEQLLIDVEVYKMSYRMNQGIDTAPEKWLCEVIANVGPSGQFLGERSTIRGIRGGEWYLPDLGLHDTYEMWEAAGRPRLLDELKERVSEILTDHQPLPLPDEVIRELEKLEKSAQKSEVTG